MTATDPLRGRPPLAEVVTLVERETTLGTGSGYRDVPAGAIQFGRPFVHAVGLERFPPSFQSLADARDWQYVRLVLPFALQPLPPRREWERVTVDLRDAGPGAAVLDAEPPRPLRAGGLVRALAPVPVDAGPAPDDWYLDDRFEVTSTAYGADALSWTLADADAEPLAAGGYVVAAVLRVAPHHTELSGELSAVGWIRRPALGRFRLASAFAETARHFAEPIAGQTAPIEPVGAIEPTHLAAEGQSASCLFVATDVEAYSPRGTDGHLAAQQRLIDVLEGASRRAGLTRTRWQRQAGGDGELAVLPPDVDPYHAVPELLRALRIALFECNRDLRDEARIRIRLALHFGSATRGANGFAGNAAIHVCRLRDSAVLRRRLAEASDSYLAVALSEQIHADVLVREPAELRLTDWQAATVDQPEKDFHAQVWIHTPPR